MYVCRGPKTKPEEKGSTDTVDLLSAKIEDGSIKVTINVALDAKERFPEVDLYFYAWDIENLDSKMKKILEAQKRLQENQRREDEEEIRKLNTLLDRIKDEAGNSETALDNIRTILIRANRYQ